MSSKEVAEAARARPLRKHPADQSLGNPLMRKRETSRQARKSAPKPRL